MRKRLIQFVVLLTFAFAATTLDAQTDQPEFTDQQLEFFESKVRPLLVEKCFDCHGPEADPVEGGLSLASRTDILAGGDNGPAIQPGDSSRSLLVDAINYGDVYQMPPDTKLAKDEIATLTEWVEMGAPWPSDSDVAVNRKEEFDLASRKAAHWCWHAVQKSAIPQVADKSWPVNAIDNFVLARLEASQLSPAPQADKRVLVRRLYFDLIGLPPTPDQIESFLNDHSKDAYSKVVEDLLASPHFGERWARHWMDLVRYAETAGHEFDYAIPHAYPYRSYLIRAFNEDVPYDQFVKEHIAGDLLDSPRLHPSMKFNESLIGTGFWFFHEGHHGPVDVKADEAKRIDNQIDVMTKTFLGLTVSCARCHDHKFDAISTEDYYSLYGFLKSSRRQDAMLDQDRKIETNFAKSKRIVEKAQPTLNELSERLRKAGRPNHL